MKVRFLIAAAISAVFPLVAAGGETVRIVTKENAIREQCRFFAPVKVKVRYGDEVSVVSREGDWLRVKIKGASGCIHKSAIEEKSFSLAGVSGGKGGASRDEVALAGKGFNPQIEESFRNKHPDLDFGKVDRLERYVVPEDSLREFIRSGGLNQP